jgi:hypothetical protein
MYVYFYSLKKHEYNTYELDVYIHMYMYMYIGDEWTNEWMNFAARIDESKAQFSWKRCRWTAYYWYS